MKNLSKIEKILNLVQKSARYINSELNSHPADMSAGFSVLLSVLHLVMRLRLRFSKRGTVKFISHLEQIEVFRRTARRSNLPLAFTAGFSPQVKSSYGHPLSIGQESASEYIELYFTQKVDIEEAKKEFVSCQKVLNYSMPKECL
jgi:hypothetical protein